MSRLFSSRPPIILCFLLYWSFGSIAESALKQHPQLLRLRAACATAALLAIPFQSVNAIPQENIMPIESVGDVGRSGKVTSKVYLDISIARGPAERITLGVFGDDAPAASKFFLSVCKGDYGDGVSYDGAQVSRIELDKRIDVGKLAKGGSQKQETWMDGMGKVRIRSVSLASKTTHRDVNNFLNDESGVLSVKKGGGSFDFTISPKPNPSLDSENVVIGKVISGMNVVDEINKVPTSKEDIIGSKGGFSALGKGFDGRAKLAAVGRPLKRINVLQCQVEEKASISSFLKF